jgi:putative endonuclease
MRIHQGGGNGQAKTIRSSVGCKRSKGPGYYVATRRQGPLRTYLEKTLMPLTGKYYVYLITNWNNRVMYVGVTNNVERRINEHEKKLVKGFTEKYNVSKLVYFEETQDVTTAIKREKGG